MSALVSRKEIEEIKNNAIKAAAFINESVSRKDLKVKVQNLEKRDWDWRTMARQIRISENAIALMEAFEPIVWETKSHVYMLFFLETPASLLIFRNELYQAFCSLDNCYQYTNFDELKTLELLFQIKVAP